MDSAKAVAFLAAQGSGTIPDYLTEKTPRHVGGNEAGVSHHLRHYDRGNRLGDDLWKVITNTKWHEKPGTGNDSTVARYSIVVTNDETLSYFVENRQFEPIHI
ncbi:MAG: hypothetical protein ACLQDL_14805 [Spirochaetia bacterium]